MGKGKRLGTWLAVGLLTVMGLLGVLSRGNADITIAQSGGTNLAPNPSFESGDTSPQGWLAWQEGDCPSGYKALSWDRATGHDGSSSLTISLNPQAGPAPASCAARWLSDFVPVDPNLSYRLSATMKSTGNATGSLWVIAYNADGHYLTARFTYADYSSPDWFSVSSPVTAVDGHFSPGTTQVRLALDIKATRYPGFTGQAEPSFQGAAAVWIDEVFFGVPPGAAPVFPTATPTNPASAAERAIGRLNYYRITMGMLPVSEYPLLSVGAQNHANYLYLHRFNPLAQAIRVHDEQPWLPGYTEQGTVAGRRGLIFTGTVTSWEDAIDGWMATPLHRLPLVDPRLTKVGLGHDWEPELRQWESYVLDPGGRDEGMVGFYPVALPANGQRDVPPDFNGIEDPNPIPLGSPLPVGYPITLTFHPSTIVIINSATLKDMVGTDVETYQLFPNAPGNIAVEFIWNSAILIPKRPLTMGTSYTVTITGTSNGSPFTRTWYFVVRNAPPPPTPPPPRSATAVSTPIPTPTVPPTPTPTPTPTAIPTPTPTAIPTTTPTPSTPATPTATPTPAPSPRPGVYPIEVALQSITAKLILAYSYDPATPVNAWSVYDPRAPAFANTLNEVRTGQGLWIKVSELAELTYNNFRYTLAPGWNVIGWR